MFRFRQFNIEDDQSTLKVGTDAMLLGAWTDVKKSKRILDIGTGCGVIALMLAQKSNAIIDAIDIDLDSIKQAKENFNNSEYSDRLHAYQCALNDFKNTFCYPYDLIVSNPPFFENSLKPLNHKVRLAKHQNLLTYQSLVLGVSELLSELGRFAVIIPFMDHDNFIDLATSVSLHCNKRTMVFPKPEKLPSRILLEFGKLELMQKSDELILRNEDNSYTDDYRELTLEYHIGII